MTWPPWVRSALIEPAPTIELPEHRRRMRWLSIALLCVLPLVIVGAAVERGELALYMRAFLGLLLGAYALTRTRYYRAAVLATVAALLVQSASAMLSTEALATREGALFAYIWLLIPFGVSALFLPARGVLAVAGVVALVLVSHATLVAELSFPQFGPSLALLVVIALVVAANVDMRAKDLEHIRTQAIELHRAKQAAEAATRAKSAFLANMSHELRTPMNAVQGMVSLVLDGEREPARREALAIVQQSGNALMTLLNDILDFSKLDAEHLSLQVGAFSLREQVQQALDATRERPYAEGIDLHLEWDEATPELVCTDRARLRQVLDNLLDNAAKFTDRGGVSLRMGARPLDTPELVPPACKDGDPSAGLQLVIEVADTGRGIAELDRERVFEVFSQGDASSTRMHGGTGLGLAICRRLVALMGGRLALKSTLDVGTTFTVTLPVTRPTPEAAARIATEQAEHRARTTVRTLEEARRDSPLSVLLVEDNLLNQKVALSMLQRLGHRADVADDGREALDAVHRRRYDVVLMDVQMPVMDGLEATRHIRQATDVSQPYIVAVTAHTLQGDREDCLAAGMDEYLGKPFGLRELERVLHAGRARVALADGAAP